MTTTTSIFGLRFKSNEAIQPGPHELSAFLDGPKKEGRKERHADDLAAYTHLLKAVDEFERGAGEYAFHEKMLYNVLAHSHLIKPALMSAVVQYKYHCRTLGSLDMKKPVAFIKSAEEEIGRLNPKKKDEALRIARLQTMVDERKHDLEVLKANWADLAEELGHIAGYVRDNLVEIRKLCEASIALLVDLQIGRKEEAQLIEDIKTHFKEQIRDYLHQGPVTKQYLEEVKETVARLSKQISLLLLEDIYTISGLYESVHAHAGKTADKLDELAARIAGRKHASLEADKELYGRIEDVLVSLVSGCSFDVKAREEVPGDRSQEKILIEKRKEMLGHLFAMLRK